MESKFLVLNAAGGKIKSIDVDKYNPTYNLLNVDLGYYSKYKIDEVEDFIVNDKSNKNNNIFINSDIFEFLEKTILKFNIITVYRFLEHVSKSNIQYFLYLLATSLKLNGEIDIIVPDSHKLAKMLIDEDINDPSWHSLDLLLTYELLADQPSPHLSLWSEDRLKYFIEAENYFKIISIEKDFNFDGRDIYLRAKARRIR
jgi:hypothetical protein